ncbi:Peptidase C39 family protein [Maioricimonas rarisocia]|uniref:Peptidase C39 family protein n=1 Tax=Maioricimonas rarisocia TaxID=2528026 RepID=A0A517Z2I0_9PLAN|nr:Peptidase C39 family protein [Maioricimonas rarisocia]
MNGAAITTLCAVALPLLLNGANQAASLDASPRTPPASETAEAGALQWEPSWRDRGDCGPVALYILMRLQGRETSIEDVKSVVPYNADLGCSLATLAEAAEEMDFPAELRFVRQQDLPRLGVPFIYHSEGSLKEGTGHFGVVAGYSAERDQFITIDTEFESSGWIPVENLSTRYSGYVLIPKQSGTVSGPQGQRFWILSAIGVAWAGILVSGRIRRRPATVVDPASKDSHS